MNAELLIFWVLIIIVPIFFVTVSEIKKIKKIIVVCLLLLLGAVGYSAYMEVQLGTTTFVPSDLTGEEILEEMPDIAITEEDMAMMRELLESEVIAEAFLLAEEEKNGYYAVPWVEDAGLEDPCIPEEFEVSSVSVSVGSGIAEKSVLVVYRSVSEPFWLIYYWFDPDFEHLQKTIHIRGEDFFGDIHVVTYDNLNGELTKWEDKRIWFDWVRKYFAPVKVNLSSDYKLDVEWNGEDITSQLSEAEMEEIRQVLETTSCNRRWYEVTSFSVDENMVAISVRNESDYSGFVYFCFSGSEGKYTFQSTERTYRIRNGEEMLQSILAIISE